MSWTRSQAAAWAVAMVAAACGSSSERTPRSQVGTAAGRALVAAMEATEKVAAPHRCAAMAAAGAAGVAAVQGTIGTGDAAWQRDGSAVRATRARLVIAAVAQARGVALPDGLRAKLAAEHPDVVLAVGGMGTDQADLERALAAVAVPGALVVALAGDSESWPALTAAIDHLAAGGTAIVDGAAVRLVDAGAAVIGTLPGLAYATRLGAGAHGCMHDQDDVFAARHALLEAAGDRPAVLVSPRAPRGYGTPPTGNHDRVAGVHTGDPELTPHVTGVGLSLFVHGLGDAPVIAGDAPLQASAVVAAGSLDPGPRWDADGRPLGPTVTIAIVDGRGVRWRTVAADAW